MDSGSVARRYAKALFGLAVENGKVEAWSESLATLAAVLRSTPELGALLADPLRSREERKVLAERLGAALALEREPANLLLLLGDRNRLGQLADVLRAFGELADVHLGRLRARVTTAVPIDGETLASLAHRLSELTRAQVLLERSVEPTLLGGAVTQVGSLVYDGSVRTQLEDLRKSLKN
jgi:F-type H+-transporting ATPase subunit delta